MSTLDIFQKLFLTLGVVLTGIAVIYCGNRFFDHKKLHRIIMPNTQQKFFEFIVFKFALYAIVIIWLALLLLDWWGVPTNIVTSTKYVIFEGTTIYGIKLIPMRLLIALLVFAIIQMSWKFALLYFSKVKKIDPEADTYIVITSILSYVVLAIAILCGLSVSGVDFTGLAIIAGALSIGIGLGLQNIVNNFVSGLILLIEKPIKPGDRVLIQGKEGFVKKISFRYTRIETIYKEDVIVPNSDLMSAPIVNFTFDDKVCKLQCNVGVAYDSDLDLVKETLLNVGLKHPEVFHDPVHKPVVFLNEFGENNLCFEMLCVIGDVNRKHLVRSELNFMIAHAFRENNIKMAFPQRELHGEISILK